MGDEAKIIDPLPECSQASLADAADFARAIRVLLLWSRERVPIDISLVAIGFERRAVDTAEDVEFIRGVRLRLCIATALVCFKVFAGRPRDWLDIEGIVARSGKRIDWNEAARESVPLLELKGDTDTLPRLAVVRAAAQG